MVYSAPTPLTRFPLPTRKAPQREVSQSPLTPRQLKVVEALKRNPHISSPIRQVREVKEVQKGLKPGEHRYVNGKFICPDSFHIPVAEVGSGGNNRVYASRSFFTKNVEVPGLGRTTPSRPLNLALRVAKVAGNASCPLLEKINSAPGLDRCFAQYQDDEGKLVSLHQLYKGTLNEINYRELPNSIEFLLKTLKNLGVGLRELHTANLVHRDIKGSNTLVDLKKPAVITDHDDTTLETNIPRRARGTSLYLDPSCYPSFESLRQKIVVQNKATDIYAFGRMIELDVLMYILQDFGGDDTEALRDEIWPVLIEPDELKFSDDELKEHYQKAVYISPKMKGHDLIEKESLLIFKPISGRFKIMKKGLEKIGRHLSDRQNNALSQLTFLAYQLQAPMQDQRPTAEDLCKSLTEILDPFIDKKRERRDSLSPYKRPAKRMRLTSEGP